MNFVIKNNSRGFYIADIKNHKKFLLKNGEVSDNLNWDNIAVELFYFESDKAAQDALNKFYFKTKYVQLKNGGQLCVREESVYLVNGEQKTLADINNLLNEPEFKLTIEKKTIFVEM